MAILNSSRRPHRAFALPVLAAATIFAVAAWGPDETADVQVLDVDAGQVDVSEWLGEGNFTFFAPNNEAFLGPRPSRPQIC